MPETIEYDHHVHTTNSEDAKLYAVFYQSFQENSERSKTEGRAIFDDLPFIKIFTPGDRSNVIDRPVRPTDKTRFSRQWQAFNNQQEQRASGTPLVEWPIITRGQAEELKYLGFSTVEQIADANDGVNYMGLQDLKNKAKAFLEIAKGNTAPISELTKLLEETRAQNKVQAESLIMLQAEVKELTSKLVKKA